MPEHDGEDPPVRPAFISYVREDSDHVNRLQRQLERAGIRVWRDTADLWPGEDWQAKIRQAIQDNALVFIACFSRHSAARSESFQNEEIALAIDQLRRRRPADPWLIPVRFSDCDIPDLDIGTGRTLRALQHADLFGADSDQAAARLVASVLRLLSPAASQPGPGVRTAPTAEELAAQARFRELRIAQHSFASVGQSGNGLWPRRNRVKPDLGFRSVLRRPGGFAASRRGGKVQCPICLHIMDWKLVREAGVFTRDNRGYETLARRVGESEQQWRYRSDGAYVRCPGSSNGIRGAYGHFLPALYGAYGTPFVIPAIGDVASGKTTLLTMICSELTRGNAFPGDLSFRPLNQEIGHRFRYHHDTLVEERRLVSKTALDGHDDFFHAWAGYNHKTGRPFVLAFFDVGGEIFYGQNYWPEFISAASAFLFLIDPERLRRLSGDAYQDRVAANVIERVSALRGSHQFINMPAATVIAKSDILVAESPAAARWLFRDDDTDLGTLEQESKDAYSYLSETAGPEALLPVHRFVPTTVHFISATGTSHDPQTHTYPAERFGPRRVLRPLLSLLSALGVVEPDQFSPREASR